MKTLLFVAPGLGYGGAEKNFVGIANYAAQHGYQVYMLTEEGSITSRPLDTRIKRLYASINPNARFLVRWFDAIYSVRHYVKETKADVVISFIEFWRSASILACLFSNTKCIVSERADPYSRGRRHDKLVFKIFEMADGYVFQTKQAMNYFSKKVKKKGVVIPNPVFEEDKLDKYIGEKRKIIVSIARLDLRQKRQDVLINAFVLITDRFPDYKLYLYGDGDDRDQIEELVRRLNLEDKVVLKGATSDVYHAIGEAMLMVLSSDFEGIPNAIIESMSVGVPVVSTKCSPGGAELLIKDNYNGLLVDCGDVQGMAVAISRVLSDQELSSTLVKNASDIGERFNQGDILQKWIEYIEKI